MTVPADKFQRVEIVSRKDHSPDLWSVRVRTEAPLSFKPGQYATLGVERGAKVIQKAYSIVSSPLEDEMEFFFELVPNGELTPLLYELSVGDSLWMRRQARGLFILDQVSGHTKHYLLCTVTGVAPYVSMARTLVRGGTTRENCEIVLIQAASRSWEFAYREELEALSKKIEWLRYIPCVSRSWEDAGWKGEVGRVEDIARKYLDALALDSSETTAYLCGHPQMIENCKGILQRKGFPKESVREEIYWIPAKPSKAQVMA